MAWPPTERALRSKISLTVVATVFLVRPVEVARVHGIEAARASLVAMVTEAAAVRNTPAKP